MNDYEEISLKELIQIVLKGWKIILASVLVMLGISVILFFTYNSTTYITQTSETLIYTEEQYTEIGIYELPFSEVKDFLLLYNNSKLNQFISKKLNISVDELNDSIKYKSLGGNEYQVTVSNSSKENNKIIHEAILDYSSEYINYAVSDKGISLIDISLNQELALLNKTVSEKTIIANHLENELNQTTMIISNNINPIYSSLSDQWILTKKEILEAEILINEININIPRIDEYKSKILTFEDYLTFKPRLSVSKIEIIHDNILNSESARFSAKTLFPVSIILGLMLGIFIVFFKKYWDSSTKRN